MELRQLEYLIAVVEEANFTRAAERLHLAQPGVSAQIRHLERELGHTLLDRSTRNVRPTEAGAAILGHARAALAAVAQVRATIDELDGLLRGRVCVGTVATGGQLDLPDRLADFHHQHPGVDITLTEAGSQQLIDNLTTGTLDLALIGLADTTPPGLETEIITDRPLVAIIPEDHPLARQRSVKLSDLADQPLITMPAGAGIRTALDVGFTAARLRPRIAFEAGDPATLMRLVDRGLGIAILLAAERTGQRPRRLREIPITRPQIHARLVLAWRADPSTGTATTALVNHLINSLAPTGRPGPKPHPCPTGK